jgi:predicted GNAT family N-acyltransferase
MILRLLKQDDIKQCVEIVWLNYNMQYDNIESELNSMFNSSYIKPIYLVIEENNKIVSFGGYSESSIDYDCFEIFWINTHPDYIKMGYATLIINEIINYIKNKSKEKNFSVILSCKKNLKIFYEKFGFKKIMKRPNENGYIMGLNIYNKK